MVRSSIISQRLICRQTSVLKCDCIESRLPRESSVYNRAIVRTRGVPPMHQSSMLGKRRSRCRIKQ